MIFEIAVIFALTFFNYVLLKNNNKNQRAIFFIATLFRIGLLIYQTIFHNLPMAGGDWGVFHFTAINILSEKTNILTILVADSSDLYIRIVAVMYRIFGANDHLMYLFSYIMSQFTFILIYKIAYLFSKNNSISGNAANIFYLWPMEMIFSVAYLREMTIQFFFAMSFLFFAKYLFQKKVLYYFIACFLSFICAQIHSGMIAILIAYIAVLFFYNNKTNRINITPLKVVFVALACVVLYGSGLLNSGLSRFASINSLNDALKMSEVEASTTYINSPGSLWIAILQSPIRLVYFVTAPWPWHIRSINTLIAYFLDGIIRLYAMREMYKSYSLLKKVKNRRKDLFVAVFIVWFITELFFSWGTNNFGTAMRHRLKVFPIEIILMFVLRKTQEREMNKGV